MSDAQAETKGKKKNAKPGAALLAYAQLQLTELDGHLGLAVSADPEAVHGARLALRRFRSAVSAYKNSLPPLPKQDRTILKMLARRLGESRDAYVMARRLELAMDAGTTWRRPAAIRGFIGALDAHSSAQVKLLATSGPDLADCRRSIRNLKLALDAEPGKAMGRKKARAALQSRWAAVQEQLESTMAEAPEEAHFMSLHETRKALKALRYAVEAVSEAFPDSASTILEPAIIQQRLLGDQHDAVVARSRLRAAAGRHALDSADATALGEMESSRALNAEVEFYRAAGQNPVPRPESSLTK